MRKVNVLLSVLLLMAVSLQAQDPLVNTSARLLNTDSKLSIGGYGQIDFNRDVESDVANNANLDVHRLVLMFGYNFSDRASFVTEIEVEHVKEIYIEQAFLDYNLFGNTNLRAGLMLVPMGIINEYHEPTTFHGVERPNIHKNVVPTTWREIGIGLNGVLGTAPLRYQLYVMNGFKSYDGSGILKGSNAMRSGRQKGAESMSSYPSFSGKVDFYGVPGLNLGLAGYVGKTQSSLYDGLDKTDKAAVAEADSSIVDVAMGGIDARYKVGALQLRGEYIFGKIGNTDQYNEFTGKDLGSSIYGYYVEAAYDLFAHCDNADENQHLYPFVRYEAYDTHNKVEGITANDKYNRTEVTAGLSWHVANGAALKADYQWLKNEATDEWLGRLNMGVAVWF